LTRDLPDWKLQQGGMDAVVHCHKDKGVYEVEFVTLAGETVGVVTVSAQDIRRAGPRDMLHTRAVA
jgi:hypothetical protein